MSSGLTEDDRERIEAFCETPPYDRSPEDLRPDPQCADDVRSPDGESDGSLVAAVYHRLRRRF
ncbi:hypothetical protein [Halorussus caseinilyticus]|uniref:Uncharacterized protein n=1 Tax=Halorussus caseinilyticus TaxID=3034025 RepID=A0ABD5WLS9_9EURY|nr:hypothetical protein [Halorussus sp. DT72]